MLICATKNQSIFICLYNEKSILKKQQFFKNNYFTQTKTAY